MINQLLKVGVLIATGRFFKQRWRGVLAVLAVWIVLWVVHGEYIRYVELSGNTRFVLHASLAKILVYLLSIAIYVWRVERPLWPRTPAPAAASAALAHSPQATPQKSVIPSGGDDGFDFLRRKNKPE